MRNLMVILSLWLYSISAYGFELEVKKVTDSVYALVGEINKRIAGAYYTPRLFDNPTLKRIVGLVQRFLP